MCWRPAGSVYIQGKLSTAMYAVIKRGKGSPRKFVFLQKAPVQMFGEREEEERQILVHWKAQRSAPDNINNKRQRAKTW